MVNFRLQIPRLFFFILILPNISTITSSFLKMFFSCAHDATCLLGYMYFGCFFSLSPAGFSSITYSLLEPSLGHPGPGSFFLLCGLWKIPVNHMDSAFLYKLIAPESSSFIPNCSPHILIWISVGHFNPNVPETSQVQFI